MHHNGAIAIVAQTLEHPIESSRHVGGEYGSRRLNCDEHRGVMDTIRLDVPELLGGGVALPLLGQGVHVEERIQQEAHARDENSSVALGDVVD